MTDYKINDVVVINTKQKDLSEYNGERVIIVDKLLDYSLTDYEVKFDWGEKVKVRANELTPIKDEYKHLKLKVGDDVGLLYENEDKVRVSKIDWLNEQVEIQYDNENFKVVKLSDIILENNRELEWVKVADKVERDKDLHKQILDEIHDTYIRKNADYGNSFGEQFDEYGLLSLVIRLDDKMRRLKQLMKQEAQVKDESIRDTILDLSNYGIMGVMELDKK